MFKLEQLTGLKFDLDVKRPLNSDKYEYSIVFDGKDRDNELKAANS